MWWDRARGKFTSSLPLLVINGLFERIFVIAGAIFERLLVFLSRYMPHNATLRGGMRGPAGAVSFAKVRFISSEPPPRGNFIGV